MLTKERYKEIAINTAYNIGGATMLYGPSTLIGIEVGLSIYPWFMADVHYNPGNLLPWTIASVVTFAYGSAADIFSTLRGLKASKDTEALGITTTTRETNPFIADQPTFKDLIIGNRYLGRIPIYPFISMAALGGAIYSPPFGIALGVMGVVAACQNEMQETMIRNQITKFKASSPVPTS